MANTPKENLTAYQRWELNVFDDPRAVKAPTADQLQRIQQEAYQEGFAAGMKDGREQAMAQARQMQELMSALHHSMLAFEEVMAQDIMELALDIARQLVRRALEVEPELVLNVVREAIDSLPHAHQNPTLTLHPQDAELVRAMLAQEYRGEEWRINEDPQLERGGCRVEIATTEIDANLETRWQRIVEALGSNAPWRK